MKEEWDNIQRFKRLRTEYRQIASKKYSYVSTINRRRAKEIEALFKLNKIKLITNQSKTNNHEN